MSTAVSWLDRARGIFRRTATVSEAAPAAAVPPMAEPAAAAPAFDLALSPGTPVTPVSGLLPLRFILSLGQESALPAGAMLALAVGGHRHEKRVDPAMLGREQEISVHTHLLPDGPATFRLTVSDAEGRPLAAAETTVPLRNDGPIAASVRESMQRFGTPLFVDGLCDSGHYDYAADELVPWFDRPDAEASIQRWEEQGSVTPTQADQLRRFVRDGFVVVEDAIEPALLGQIREELDDAVARRHGGYQYGSSERIVNLHQHYPGVRRLWAHPGVMDLLRLIFRAEPRPCQTLTFIFGSQQDVHQDSVHLTPFPAGYMCGVWVAIDDVQPESGELEVLRGSHRLPRVRMRETDCPKVTDGNWIPFAESIGARWRTLAETGNYERIVYRPKAGAALIWHENLMHGGSARRDQSLSRRSIVSHVFADGAVAYYDSTGMVGTMERLEAS